MDLLQLDVRLTLRRKDRKKMLGNVVLYYNEKEKMTLWSRVVGIRIGVREKEREDDPLSI